jgi:hypothetical protein
MTAPIDCESFFAGSATAAKFEDRAYNTVIGGEIVEEPRMQQQRDYESGEPLAYPDGNPMMQMVVIVQAQSAAGDDDGRRAFYIKGQLKQAVGEALRKAGVKVPQAGGVLQVKYVRDEPTTLRNGKRGNDKKIYAARYTPPAGPQGAFFAETHEQPATEGAGGPPAGVGADTWAAMSPQQRQVFADTLRGGGQTAAASGAEPPF